MRDDWNQHWRCHHASARLNPAQDFRRRILVYHMMRIVREERQSLRILDIGSGTGDFAGFFLSRFPSAGLLGLEYSQTGVEISSRQVPAATFLQRDLREPQQPPAEFRRWANMAVCSEVLEHIDEPVHVLENIKPYLAPGAHLVMTVPGGPMSAFDRHIGHRRHFTPPDLHRLLVTAGYDVEGTWGSGFPFFNLYRLVVIARGERLIEDSAGTAGLGYHLSRLVMRTFGVLFRLNAFRLGPGWQTVGIAHFPAT